MVLPCLCLFQRQDRIEVNPSIMWHLITYLVSVTYVLKILIQSGFGGSDKFVAIDNLKGKKWSNLIQT